MNCSLYKYIIGVASIFFMSSCGQQHDAECLVDAFLEENAVHPEKIENRNFLKLDSTKLISDSLIDVFQHRKNELFKPNIKYAVNNSGRMLYYIRMNFTYEGDTLYQTFYIDESFGHIVAFK